MKKRIIRVALISIFSVACLACLFFVVSCADEIFNGKRYANENKKAISH